VKRSPSATDVQMPVAAFTVRDWEYTTADPHRQVTQVTVLIIGRVTTEVGEGERLRIPNARAEV
jgi:hypothetical protein